MPDVSVHVVETQQQQVGSQLAWFGTIRIERCDAHCARWRYEFVERVFRHLT